MESPSLTKPLVVAMTNHLLSVGSSSGTSEDARESCKSLLASLRERHPATVDATFLAASSSTPNAASLLAYRSTKNGSLTDVYSADVSARIQGVKEVLRTLADAEASDGDRQAASSAILSRLGDEEIQVIEAVYSNPESLAALPVEEYINAVEPSFVKDHFRTKVVAAHVAFLRDHLLPRHPEIATAVFQRLVFPVGLMTKTRQVDVIPWIHSSGNRKGDKLGSILEKISHDHRLENGANGNVLSGVEAGMEHNEMVVRLLAGQCLCSLARLR